MNEQTPEFIKQQQEAARELLEAKQAETPEGKSFRPDSEREALAVQTAKILKFKPKEQAETAPEIQEVHVSDKTQEFINRLVNSKSKEESVKIMNEVLAATEAGKIPPGESTDLLQMQRAA